MKKIFQVIFILLLSITGFSQMKPTESLMKVQKDSSLRAAFHADSLKIEKQYAEKERWEKIKASSIFPAINAGEYSGVVPVKDPTEVPDPTIDYKLLFELTFNNPDSVAKDINYGLVEVARVINLHVASGIPLNKILPVIVVHGGALNAFCTNNYYKEHYKLDNPNLKLIDDLKNIDARFIACGQAMTFHKINKEDLLADIKVSLTAQTVLSSYQLKGYVWYDLGEIGK
jgi:intracellular sulfur oxidation DsrE/DsrF family protein